MQFYYDKIPETLKVNIQSNYFGVITSFLAGDIGIGGTARFSSPFSGMDSSMDLVNKTFFQAGAFASDKLETSLRAKTLMSTYQDWESSSPFSIRIPLVLFAMRANEDIRVTIRTLVKSVFPVQTTDSLSMRAPMEHTILGQNAISVWIGKWFRTPNVFILQNVNFLPSKEVNQNGLPIFATGEIQMEAYRQVFADDIEGWLS